MAHDHISHFRLIAYTRLARIRPTIVSAWLKKLLRLPRVQTRSELGNFWLDPVSHLGQTLLHGKIHEPSTVQALQAVLSEGNTFIDLGSNEGYFSIIASALVGNTGRVYAIEPQRRLQMVLQKNIELNGARNIVIRRCAISNQAGKANLYLSPNTNTGSSGFYRATRYGNWKETVETETLDAFFQRERISSCDLLKIDIEGHEYEAIFGSTDIFRSGAIKAVVLEIHREILKRRGLAAEKITDFLADCGYCLDERFAETSMWIRGAPFRNKEGLTIDGEQ